MIQGRRAEFICPVCGIAPHLHHIGRRTMAKKHVVIDARWVRCAPYKRAGSDYFTCKVRDMETRKVHTISTREKSASKAFRAVQRWVERFKTRESEDRVLGQSFAAAFEEWLGLKTDIRPVFVWFLTAGVPHSGIKCLKNIKCTAKRCRMNLLISCP